MWRQIDNRRATKRGIPLEWQLTGTETPPLAAHLVTARRGYTHHGIYVGNGKVVHYAGLSRSWRSGPVEEVTLAEFACGRPIRVRPCNNPQFDPNEVVARARSRLGENCYQVLTNNCEHFCEWCLRGKNRSSQVDRIRSRPRRAVLAVASFVEQPLLTVREAIWNWYAWSGCARA